MISRWLTRSQKRVPCPSSPTAPPGSIRELLLRVERQLADDKRDRAKRRRIPVEFRIDRRAVFRTMETAFQASIDRNLTALRAQLADLTGEAVQRALLKPLVERLILLADRMAKDRRLLAASADSGSAADYDEAVGSFIRELLMVLETLEVRPLCVPAGAFDPACQQAIKKAPAPQPELDGTVKEILRSGYTWRGVVLRPEQVVVYEKES